MNLSERLGLEPAADLTNWIMPPASAKRRQVAEEQIEADRRATIDRVVSFLAHHQDAQGVDTWPARRALRELLEEGGDG